METTSLLQYALTLVLGNLLSAALAFVLFRPSRYHVGYEKDGSQERGADTESDRQLWSSKSSVQVVVLGDIGRSPRMQYHAISLAKHGARVYIIGYVESEIHPTILASPLTTIVPLFPPPRLLQTHTRLLFPIIGPMKAIHQALSLFRALAYRTPPTKHCLVQNPPSIPTLAIAILTARLRNTRLAIDWHNLGYSVLALRFQRGRRSSAADGGGKDKQPRHPLVRLARLYELGLAHFASAHLAVSAAMARQIQRTAKDIVTPVVLYDRPAPAFRPIESTEERAAFLRRLPDTAAHAASIVSGECRLVVSSTSWSADEDFGILLEALVRYSGMATARGTEGKRHPRILAIITGKGPQKRYYLDRIAALSRDGLLSETEVKTAWLPHEDYARLLACADLGISLHQSTSGVDLPMKVVDMMGAGLPVAGWDRFEAWPELVKEGVNGVGFEDSEGLAGCFEELFDESGGKSKSVSLESLEMGAIAESKLRWDDEWDKVGGKLFGVT
ncbi:MAG: mannosyltransferase [Alyxoria varia]|nr:MAG: mannosyltransferase [Alyxoria varia]